MSDGLLNKIKANLEYQKQFGDLVFVNRNVISDINLENELENVNKGIESISVEKEKVIKSSSKNSVNNTWINSKTLDELNEKIHNCMECPLGETRKSFVFGSGNPNSKILIIGEAPGIQTFTPQISPIARYTGFWTKPVSMSFARISAKAGCR